jgi:CRP-like cAMP-binding protein
MSNRQSLKRLTLLFREGAPADQLYIVKKGRVLCLKSNRDRLTPVFRAEAEDLVGESAIIEGEKYGYSAVTLEDCELLQVPADSFRQVLKTTPEWLRNLTLTMLGRFQTTAELIAENRVQHPAIVDEGEFTPELEVELKKLISKTE